MGTFLAIDYNVSESFGRTYYFAGLCKGNIKGERNDFANERRLYFNGSSEQDCINNARIYCDALQISCSRTKINLLLNEIETTI